MVEIQETNVLLEKLGDAPLLVIAGIPAYNEEKTIARVVLGAQKHSDIVVVCDDGSSDLTGEIAERLGAIVIRHGCNLGYGAALQSLFKRAKELKADVLVTLDSDGQHDPAQIPTLVKPIKEGTAEVVLGSRFKDKSETTDMPTYRRFGIKIITKLSNGSTKNGVSDAQSGFRAYSKHAIKQLSNISENGMSASIELLRSIQKSNLSLLEVPISCKYAGTTGVETSSENAISHGFGLVASIIKLVVEDKPMQTLGLTGIAFLVAGIFFGIWMMSMYAASHEIVTNVALASVSFILIGFFLMSTAITLFAIKRLSQKLR